MKLGKIEDFFVEIVEWQRRPGPFGPAVIRREDKKIVSGPWVEGTEIKLTTLPYRTLGECAAASVTTPDGNHHYSFLI